MDAVVGATATATTGAAEPMPVRAITAVPLIEELLAMVS